MGGESEPAAPLSIPPTEVITRLSTDVNAIADPDVAAAMKFIREHACEGIGVDDVLSQVPVSRSVLQRRFRSLLGRSIHAVIAGVKLQRAKQLLVETDLPLAVIAKRTGFTHVEYLCTAFRQAVGLPPGAYRREPAQLPRAEGARSRDATPRPRRPVSRGVSGIVSSCRRRSPRRRCGCPGSTRS